MVTQQVIRVTAPHLPCHQNKKLPKGNGVTGMQPIEFREPTSSHCTRMDKFKK
jgi:hypothetical protein